MFAERLKSLRKSKNVTQVQMAALLGYTEQHYQRLEYGKVNVPMSTLIALAELFNTSIDYLVGLSDNPQRR
jgi:transcriptional regulator with XRE-family HTH domain